MSTLLLSEGRGEGERGDGILGLWDLMRRRERKGDEERGKGRLRGKGRIPEIEICPHTGS